eukprot:gene55875-38952_t
MGYDRFLRDHYSERMKRLLRKKGHAVWHLAIVRFFVAWDFVKSRA